MIEICSSLTKSEKQNFIKDMKTKLEEMEEEEEEKEEDDEQYERTNLDKFDLFKKKNYYIHILFKRICDILFSSTSVRACVYGGFIRDNILHDYMAKQFYERTLFDAHELFEKYNDPKVDCETSFRTLVPKDIDIRFYSQMDYMMFLANVKSEGYHVHAYAVSSDKYKTPKKKNDDSDEEEEEENIVKYKVEVKSNIPLQDLHILNTRLIDKEYATTSVIVDVTISEKRNSPADFLCNSVQMSRHGFSVHSERSFFGSVKDLIMEQKHEMEMIGLIEDQIHTMEAAVFCCSLHISIPDRHRIMKMVKKGWKIKIIAIRELAFLTQITSEDDDEELCIICHEKFETISVVPGVHTLLNGVKFSCCSASYHCDCLVELLKKNTHTILSRDQSSVTYKCVQCSQQKMSFYNKNMMEFLEELNSVFDEVLET